MSGISAFPRIVVLSNHAFIFSRRIALKKVCFAKSAVFFAAGIMVSSSAVGKIPQPPRVLNHGGWVTPSDFPASGVQINEPVSVDFRLAIDKEGRAQSCMIMRGSGSKVLDEWTCALVVKRARFKPAKDSEGNTTEGSYFETVRWLPPG